MTAAHEFFHADPVRLRLRRGRLAAWSPPRRGWRSGSPTTSTTTASTSPPARSASPGTPLDVFNQQGFNQYGNWTFFEYLSDRFGNGIVKSIWARAGAYPGAGHQYSTAALKGVLCKNHGGFVSVFRAYAAANTVPGRSYPEGAGWPTAPAAASWKASKADRRSSTTLKVNHMAARDGARATGSSLGSNEWHLRIVVDGPAGQTDPAAYLSSSASTGSR